MDAHRILIVEDERIIALDLQNRLQKLGYEVVGSAANGSDAVDKATRLRPDMVLMDIHLEGEMDGTEAAKLITERSGPPVVFLSAYATDDTLERALQSGPYGYLLKPIDTRELHATVQATLKRYALGQRLMRSERRLQLALDAAELGLWEWEPGSGRFTTGGLFCKVLGESPRAVDETIQHFLDRLAPEVRDSAEMTLNATLSAKQRINCQFPYIRSEGSTGWLQLHAAVCQEEGSVRLTGVVQDITERHRMEEELRQSAAVFQTLSEGLFTLDAQGLMTSANPAFEQLTGYKLEEVLGKDPEQFLHARRHSDHFYQSLLDEHDGQWQGETRCRRKDGTVFPIWESVRAVTDDKGKLVRYVAAITDISELRRAEAKVHHLAYHDPLTGLPNRMLLAERLDYTVGLMEQKKGQCAVLFLDLDGFKLINDTLGHANGDLLLQTMAARLLHRLRSTDTLARVGGDEFVVIITDLENPAEAALKIAHKLLDALIDPIELNNKLVSISGSVGIALYPGDGADRQSLLQAADTAMYYAKSQGKNQISFFTRELASQISERMNLEQDLRRAIDTDQLRVHYQPQFRLSDGTMTGVEALVRWQHPEMGLVSPASFIPIAEETGLIEPVGEWVLMNACRQLADWRKETGQPLRLAINVSVQQIRHGQIVGQIDRALAATGFPASELEIEITESTLQNLENSRRFIDALHQRGISVAIDDFGTGYSSLSVLKHQHIDRLKIDQSFVRDTPNNDQDVGIVEAIIAMARKLGLEIVAEGIEDVEQLIFLREAGCNDGQGYLLARPAPWEQIVKGDASAVS
jgi:diguanylate cyclase (GGDEF)-like protein/PAS domain S-box-containing protein